MRDDRRRRSDQPTRSASGRCGTIRIDRRRRRLPRRQPRARVTRAPQRCRTTDAVRRAPVRAAGHRSTRRATERPLRLGFKCGMAHQRSRVRDGRDADRGRRATLRGLAVAQLLHTACRMRCTCTAFTSRCWSARRRPIIVPRSRSTRSGRLATDLGRKDTVLVWPGESVRVAIDFDLPFAGPADVPVPLPQPRARGRRHDARRARSHDGRLRCAAASVHGARSADCVTSLVDALRRAPVRVRAPRDRARTSQSRSSRCRRTAGSSRARPAWRAREQGLHVERRLRRHRATASSCSTRSARPRSAARWSRRSRKVTHAADPARRSSATTTPTTSTDCRH